MIMSSRTTDVCNSKVSVLCAALFVFRYATGYTKYPHINHVTLRHQYSDATKFYCLQYSVKFFILSSYFLYL